MNQRTVYVDSFPYYKTIGISIVLNTILICLLYHFDFLGIKWQDLGVMIFTFSAELFFVPEDTVFLLACFPAAYIAWKKREIQIEVIDLKYFRIIYLSILSILSIILCVLLLYRNQGASLFIAIVLLFYVPTATLYIFVEKNKKYVEGTMNEMQ